LAEKLHACFASQIAGGKDYGKAVIGRRRANATFYDSHSVDTLDQLWFAMDLTPLIEDDAPNREGIRRSENGPISFISHRSIVAPELIRVSLAS